MNQVVMSCLTVLLLSIGLFAQTDTLKSIEAKNPMEIVRAYVREHLDALSTIPIIEQPTEINFYKKELQVRTVLGKKCSFLTFQIPQNFDSELALYFSSPLIKSWGIQPIDNQPDLQTFTPCFKRVRGMLANATFRLDEKEVASEESGLFNEIIFIHDTQCLDETSFLPRQTYFLFFQVEETLKEGDRFDAFVSLSTFENRTTEQDFRKKMVEMGKIKYLKK